MRTSHTLTKEELIRKKSDFKKLYTSSYNVSCYGAKLFFRNNDIGFNRLGVTLRKKYGNAVQRNRSRRLIKEIYRLEKDSIKGNYDLLFLLFPGKFGYEERKEQIFSLLLSAGLID